MKTLTACIEPEHAGRKIKYFVRGELGVSYHQFNSLKVRGGLLVNGTLVHANHILQPGDLVEVRLPEQAQSAVDPDDAPVTIVYEDDDILIIDKPAPLACQASDRQPDKALENRLVHHYGADFVFRPVNRLDKGTSGLMAAAKNAHAYQLLQRQLHTENFVREYLAVTEGLLPAEKGVIDLPIAKIDEASVRRIVDAANGKRAVTHYCVEHFDGKRALVRLRLETGRTHQIRVHLSHLSCPIAGDFLYGTEIAELPRRFALHSAHIELMHPLTNAKIALDSPLPQELSALFGQTNGV